MRTYHSSYGVIAIISDCKDGKARLVARNQNGKIVKDSTHKNRPAAMAAWRRLCS